MAEIVSVRRKRHDTLFSPGGSLMVLLIPRTSLSAQTSPAVRYLRVGLIVSAVGASVATGINGSLALRCSPNIVPSSRHVAWVPSMCSRRNCVLEISHFCRSAHRSVRTIYSFVYTRPYSVFISLIIYRAEWNMKLRAKEIDIWLRSVSYGR